MLLRLRNVQDLLADGKTLSEGRFGEPFKGPIIPFGAFVEYHPISMRDQSRLHQLGKKVLPNIFLGYALIAVNLERRHSHCGHRRFEEPGRINNLSSKNQCTRSIYHTNERRNHIPNSRWYSKIVNKRLRITRNHSEAETNRR